MKKLYKFSYYLGQGEELEGIFVAEEEFVDYHDNFYFHYGLKSGSFSMDC